jgi:hypothetical protein
MRTWAAPGSATMANGTILLQTFRAEPTASCQRRWTASAASGPDAAAGSLGWIHTHQRGSRGHPKEVVDSRSA